VDWTYGELANRAALVAADLEGRHPHARRIVLALFPGLHYLAGLFGIFQVGATAVPALPPIGKRAVARLQSIVLDCQPDLIVADPYVAGVVERFEADLPDGIRKPQWLFIGEDYFDGEAEGTGFTPTVAEPALLQYTSGSTGEPKGIVLTHDNLVSNCAVLDENMGFEADRVGCSWLPPYHDMGLMGTIMLALHSGWPLVMLSPLHFVQNPYRWLKAITDHGVTISVGPNFAFDLCTSSVTDNELATLDLSSLRQVYCGSEPVSRATLDRFRDRFGSRGYDEAALIPCYGLAEATLFVSGKRVHTPVRTESLDNGALERGLVRPSSDQPTASIASCGAVAAGHEVVIVDPASGHRVEPGRIGEIWVHGPNVALGYLDQPELTAKVFAARLTEDDSERTYLRTGDLGFLLDGELFVTGRIKDVIKLAGRNIYPQDIECTVRDAHERLREAAAFSVNGEDGEALAVVVEFRGTRDELVSEGDDLSDLVVGAVTKEHGVCPSDVHLVPVGAILRTTSGKVRRNATRNAYADGTLKKFVPQR